MLKSVKALRLLERLLTLPSKAMNIKMPDYLNSLSIDSSCTVHELTLVIWLILAELIGFFQRFSHACVSRVL